MADTDVLFTVGLDTRDADKTAEQLQKEIENIFNSRQGQSSARLTQLEIQMKQAYDKANALREEMQRVADTPVATQEYAQLTEQLSKYEDKYYSLIEKMSQFEEAGGDISSQKYQDWVLQFEHLEASLATIHTRMEQMEKDGAAFIGGTETEKYKQLQAELDKVNDKLKQQIIHYNEIRDKGSTTIDNTVREMGRLNTATEQVRRNTGQVVNNLNGGLRNATRNIRSLIARSAALFLGVRGLWSIIMKIRSAVMEGFKNLRESGVGQLKKQMNDLTNACTTLKNALAGAFEPIVTAIIPYIQRLVEWLTVAIDKLAQFIAAMRGQTTYIKAIKQVGDAGAKASKQLAKFDELNVLNSQGNGAAGMFEEAQIPSEMFDRVNQLKERFEELKQIADEIIIQPFKQGFNEAIGDAQGRLDSIKGNIQSIGNSLIEIYTNPEVQASVTHFVEQTSETLGQITGATARIGLNIADNITGGFSQFLKDNKDRIQEDIINTFDLSSEIVDKYGDLSQSFGEISDALSTNEAKDFTESLIDLGYTFGSESVQLALKVINDLFALFADPIIENVDAIRESLILFFEDITPVITIFKDSVQQTFDTINRIYDTYISPIIADAKHLLSELVVSMLPIINEIVKIISLVMQIVKVIQEKVQPIIDKIVDVWGPKITFVINFISGLVQGAAKIITDIVYYVFRVIRFIFELIYDLITGDVEGLFNDFMSFCDDINARVQEALQWLADLFVEKWEACKQAVQDFKDGVSHIIDAIKEKFDGFKEKIQGVIDKVKGLVDLVSGGAFGGVLSSLDSIGVKGSSIDTGRRSIPGYASGQVIPPTMGAHLAMLGDNKHETEVVSPLSTMQEAMINALQAVGMGDGQPINIYLGTDKIYSEIRKMEKRHNVMMGG